MKLMATLLAASLLTSCASAPSVQEQAAADYGTPVAQADAEAAAKEYLEARLKDPMSAVYKWTPVERGYLEKAPVLRRPALFGYILNGTVNSKNSMGGYTGAKPYQFMLHNGRVTYAAHQECLQPGSCYMAPF